MAKYRFKNPHIKLNPGRVGPELDGLRKKLGRRLTPRDIVEQAAKKNSSMHRGNWFIWDRDEAARRFNLIQAGNLMASLVSVETTVKGGYSQSPVYVKTTEKSEANEVQYEKTNLVTDKEEQNLILIEKRDELTAMADSLESLRLAFGKKISKAAAAAGKKAAKHVRKGAKALEHVH